MACKFESGKAVLLPHVCNEFHKAYELQPDSQNEEHILDTAEGTMEHKCVHKKIGTILLKTGGNLLTSLSWALGAVKGEQDEEYLYQKKSKIFKHDNIERVVREAGDIINDVIHTEIARNSSIDVLTMDRLNIDEQIENINSLLWSFVVSVTRTATQRKSESRETNLHVKKLRRYFIISLLE